MQGREVTVKRKCEHLQRSLATVAGSADVRIVGAFSCGRCCTQIVCHSPTILHRRLSSMASLAIHWSASFKVGIRPSQQIDGGGEVLTESC